MKQVSHLDSFNWFQLDNLLKKNKTTVQIQKLILPVCMS